MGNRLKTGDVAPNLKVVNADGEAIGLSSLWTGAKDSGVAL